MMSPARKLVNVHQFYANIENDYQIQVINN